MKAKELRPAAPYDADPYRCRWTTQGQPCCLQGEVGFGRYDGDKLYCAWHFALLEQPQFASDRDEFDRFVLSRREARTLDGALVRYCNQWAHHEHAALWDAANGAGPLLGQPSPCEAEGCWMRRAGGPDRRATRQEALEAIRGIRAMLAGKGGPMAESVAKVVEEVPF